MPNPDCEAGNCLPGSDSVWFLVVLIIVWATVAAVAVMWAVVCWRERQQEDIGHRPAYRPVRGPQLRSTVSVEEIRRRLVAEAAQPPPPARNITIVPREVHPPSPPLVEPAGSGPDTEPFDPFGEPDDGDGGGAGQ